jgi:arginase
MPYSKTLAQFIGSASGIAAADAGCGHGPIVLQNSILLKNALLQHRIHYEWKSILQSNKLVTENVLTYIERHCHSLALEVAKILSANQFFTVFGGDHSCAIGTWSGAQHILSSAGDIGLIWIDAHMDSHTPETSLTGNFHGMPVACLLGYGPLELTQILNTKPKIKPEHLCMIGIRSYEEGEAELLKKLNVKIYFIDEVKERGLTTILKEAQQRVKLGTVGYGVTIDIDSIDPTQAPGTGVSEPNGLDAHALCSALTQLSQDSSLIGLEIVEFDPHLDQNNKTEKIIADILVAILTGNIVPS